LKIHGQVYLDYKKNDMRIIITIFLVFTSILTTDARQDDSTNVAHHKLPWWNFHVQNTYIGQGDPGFSAKYSGWNSLSSSAQIQETATLSFFAGLRLWPGAEVHAEFLTWQGFGLSQTFGIEAFPNGDAYKAGSAFPNFTFAHLFIRQTFALGREQEDVADDPLTIAGRQAISRITITVGRMTPLDFCDGNTYAKDPHTQFLNWATMANLTWDYGEDQIGYVTGLAIDLHQPKWSLRYGFFQMPAAKNSFTADDQILMWPERGSDGPFFKAWAMMAEFEYRFNIKAHPGAIRFMPWLDEADFASYKVATAMLLAHPPSDTLGPGAGITIPAASHAYRLKYGFGLNWEQEVAKNVGLFSRLGWNNGQLEAFTFTDVNWTASLGASVKGEAWRRKHDTFGMVYIVSGASVANQKFLQAGGTDILDGDGGLRYSPERVLEAYYNFHIWRTLQITIDYQIVSNPAFNHDRGPVDIMGARLHWSF
jgi:high affinity Mn2+ porin